jgi:hypothetical protein
VDQVGIEERVARFNTRSIKKQTKLDGMKLALNMIDLTTLEGKDTEGKVKQMCFKAMHLADDIPGLPTVAAVCVYPTFVKVAKETLKNRIPDFYHLIKEIDLDDNSYMLLNEDYLVPSIFQIWERKDVVREKNKLKIKSDLISFVKQSNNPDYSFRRVGFYSGTVYDEINEKSPQSHYFIKSSLEVKEFLKNYKWDHNNTTGPRSIGKSEIVKIIENIFGLFVFFCNFEII